MIPLDEVPANPPQITLTGGALFTTWGKRFGLLDLLDDVARAINGHERVVAAPLRLFREICQATYILIVIRYIIKRK